MYTDMEWWRKIRVEVLRGETSKREILRREEIHWETLKKILSHSEPPGYRMGQPRPKPKIGPYLERIAQIIEADRDLPMKQRHTGASRGVNPRWQCSRFVRSLHGASMSFAKR